MFMNEKKPPANLTKKGNVSLGQLGHPKKEVSFSEPTEMIRKVSRINSEQTKSKPASLGPTKRSDKSSGIIKAFSANTHRGLVRNYNEDRVTIVLNIAQPSE